jgi:hypothetical protein
MSIPVFRKGSWIHYPIPPAVDSVWSQQHLLVAASFYATALSQGYPPSESASLAECYVNKQVYPELVYARQMEQKLLWVTREQHKSP